MKYFFLIILAVLGAGCAKSPQIEFTGTATGINAGTFMIKDQYDTVVCKADIKNGAFKVSREFNKQGFYSLQITRPGSGTLGFVVYLEPGKYTITTNRDKPSQYPDIRSASSVQNELTDYYHIYDLVKDELQANVQVVANQMMARKAKSLPLDELVPKLLAAENQELKIAPIALGRFIDKYPDNHIAIRMMLLGNSYAMEPEAYYKNFQKLNDSTKKSPEGVQLLKYINNLRRPVGK
jgi:hypothetical protein